MNGLAPAKRSEDGTLLTEELSALCKAAGDPLRLAVLRVLSQDSFGVLELSQIFKFRQSGMSHHLKILLQAGLVTTRREGNSIFYRRADRAVRSDLEILQRELLKAADKTEMSDDIRQRLAAVQVARAERSVQFFSENADKFRSQQELVVSYGVYGPATVGMISSSDRGVNDSVLEVGPGEGEFLSELATRFHTVYALDNSPVMLAQAQTRIQQQDLNNITFISGDTKTSTVQKLAVDCIVVNMVLHHTPSPADVIKDLSGCLRNGGQLYITELCSHDQNWAREACGDLWLGFEPEDLNSWAATAGLAQGKDMYLAQRNGFRVQIRQYVKQASDSEGQLSNSN
jgi:ArsR family transcriptional regulator